MSNKVSKKMAESLKLVEADKIYTLEEAVALAKKTSYTKFDGSIDLAFKLNLDVRKADQQLRGAVALPNGTGKKVVVLVATDDPKLQEAAKKAGADTVLGQIDLIPLLKSEKFDFDIMITEPKMMPVLGRFGKVLGPKGLMPNPKTGTVTQDVANAVVEIKKGKANYRTDKAGIVHTSIGKVSMKIEDLLENAQVIIDIIKKLKPSTVKGIYMQNLTISASMGPSIKIER